MAKVLLVSRLRNGIPGERIVLRGAPAALGTIYARLFNYSAGGLVTREWADEAEVESEDAGIAALASFLGLGVEGFWGSEHA